jgi:hypothetical protein
VERRRRLNRQQVNSELRIYQPSTLSSQLTSIVPTKLACILSLIAFASCLVIGCFSAQNTFFTTVSRALIAMGGTFVLATIVGVMAQKMLEEHLAEKQAATNPEQPVDNKN